MRTLSHSAQSSISVCMLDLNSAVPYYDAYLCSALKRSGIDLHLAAITYHLDRDCFARRGLEPKAPIDKVGRMNLPTALRKPLKLIEIAANLRKLEVAFRCNRPAILHVQYLPLVRLHLETELGFLQRCQELGLKIVYTVHDVLPHDSGDKYRSIYRRLYAIPELLICHSGAVRKELVSDFGVPESKIHVIAHGPLFYGEKPNADNSLRRELGVRSGAPVVLWQGIIHKYKGVDLLLRAWNKVLDAIPNAQLIIAGTGAPNLLKEIREQTTAPQLRDSIKTCFRYLSAEDLIEAYSLADLVVYPYKSVSTSGALMTGLALGKAIVATDLPFFRSALEGGELGTLVRFDESDLANHISQLLSDMELRRSLESRVRYKNFGDRAWDEIAQQTRTSYEMLLTSTSDF